MKRTMTLSLHDNYKDILIVDHQSYKDEPYGLILFTGTFLEGLVGGVSFLLEFLLFIDPLLESISLRYQMIQE